MGPLYIVQTDDTDREAYIMRRTDNGSYVKLGRIWGDNAIGEALALVALANREPATPEVTVKSAHVTNKSDEPLISVNVK